MCPRSHNPWPREPLLIARARPQAPLPTLPHAPGSLDQVLFVTFLLQVSSQPWTEMGKVNWQTVKRATPAPPGTVHPPRLLLLSQASPKPTPRPPPCSAPTPIHQLWAGHSLPSPLATARPLTGLSPSSLFRGGGERGLGRKSAPVGGRSLLSHPSHILFTRWGGAQISVQPEVVSTWVKIRPQPGQSPGSVRTRNLQSTARFSTSALLTFLFCWIAVRCLAASLPSNH